MQRAWIAHLLPFERAYAAGEVTLAPAPPPPPRVAAPAGLLPLAFAEATPPPAVGARRGVPDAAAAKEAGEARPRRRARLAAADGGFELFADLPEFSRADVGVRAFSRGLVRLSARCSSKAAAAGAADVSANVALPGPLDTRSAQALFGGGRL